MASDARKTCLVSCALTLVAFIYGTWQLVAKAAMSDGTSPYVFIFYRAFFGAVVMFIAMLLMPSLRTHADRPFDPAMEILAGLQKDGVGFLLLGLLMTVNISAGIMAVSRLPAITCAILQPASPMVATAMSIMSGVEAFSVNKIISLAISAAGAMIVVAYGTGSSSEASSERRMAGLFFLWMNICGGAAYHVFQKRSQLLQRYAPTFVAGMSFLIASVVLLFPAMTTAGLDGAQWRLADDTVSLLALAYAVFLTTAVNYSISAWAIKEFAPSMVTGFQTLQPVTTAMLDYFIFGVVLSSGQALGGVAIVIGLLFNVAVQYREDHREHRISKAKAPHMLLK